MERRLRPIAPLVVTNEWGGSQCDGDDDDVGDDDDDDDDDDLKTAMAYPAEARPTTSMSKLHPPVAEHSGADGLQRRPHPIAPLVGSGEWECSSRLRRDVGDDDDDGEAHAVAGWAPRPHSRLRRVPVERVSAPAHMIP